MSNTITCPNCGEQFEVTEVMSAQLRDSIRRELEREVSAKRQQLNDRERVLAERERNVDQAKQAIDEQVRQQVSGEREKIMAEATANARQAVDLELKDSHKREAELRAERDQARENELNLRKRERALLEEKEAWELKKAREIDAERAGIRDAARKQADEEHALRLKERDQQIDGMRKQIDELKRKAEQGSQQTQGEVLELALEELLRQTFPTDGVGEVGKGVSGADVLQSVRTPGGTDAGTILWESKRTRRWSSDWLPKLRHDQREAKADIAAIVSTTLPEGVDTFAQIDGVWVCAWSCAAALAAALRAGLLEAAKARQALAGQHGKMEQVYNYLAGPEFRNRVTGIVEAFATMKRDLDHERRALQKQWAKRETQIEQAIAHTAGMYGALQGIIGGSLPEIEGIDLPLLEAQP